MNKNTLLIVKTKVKKLIKQKYNYLYSQTMIMHVCIPWQKVVIIEIDCLIKNPKALNKRAQSLPDTDEFVQNHWDERERERKAFIDWLIHSLRVLCNSSFIYEKWWVLLLLRKSTSIYTISNTHSVTLERINSPTRIFLANLLY